MSRYTFTFKKDDIFVEFTTEDKDVVERQFQIWVADADDYARYCRTKIKSNDSLRQVMESKPELVAPLEEKINELSKNSDISQEELPENIEEKNDTQVFDNASNLLKTINIIQNEKNEASQESEGESGIVEEKIIASADFETVLEKSIENPTFEPDKVKDQVFLNLVRSKNTNDKFHYLVITAYYLSEFEKLERFSLKQINSKLMQNLSEVIDSATLQEALNQNLIELVPDLTGISEVTEYKLTHVGEEFFAKKI